MMDATIDAMISAMQSSAWAREYIAEREQTRSIIIMDYGAEEDVADALVERIKQYAINESLTTSADLLTAYHEAASLVRALLCKGIKAEYLCKNFKRIKWIGNFDDREDD